MIWVLWLACMVSDACEDGSAEGGAFGAGDALAGLPFDDDPLISEDDRESTSFGACYRAGYAQGYSLVQVDAPWTCR